MSAAIQLAQRNRVRQHVAPLELLASPSFMASGFAEARIHLQGTMARRVKRSIGILSDPGRAFNGIVRSLALAQAAARDMGVRGPPELGRLSDSTDLGEIPSFGDFGFSLNPIDWLASAADFIGSAVSTAASAVWTGVSTVGKAIGSAAVAVSKGAVAVWNGVKDGIQYINVLTPEGRKHLFDILVNVFFPPPLPLNYLIKRFPDLISCLSSASGLDKLVCLARWVVDALKEMINDPVFWIVLNMLAQNYLGAAVLAVQIACGTLADIIKTKKLFGDASPYVAAFIRMLGVTGDLVFIFNLGTNAFTSPATYCILGAILMQGSVDIAELGDIGQAMAENSVVISTVFQNVGAAAKKLASWFQMDPSPMRFSIIDILKGIIGGIGSAIKTIGDGISKIPLLGPMIADGIVFLGSKLAELPGLLAQALSQAKDAVVAAGKAAAKYSQAALDAAVAAAKAVAEADYKKALESAVAAARKAAEDAAAATIAGLRKAAQVAQDAALAAQRGLANALDEIKRLKTPPVGWPNLPACVWPPTSWPPPPECWPGGRQPAGPPVAVSPPVVPPGATVEPGAPPAAAKPGFWHVVIGAGTGLLLGGPPGAIAGGIAASALLGGKKP